MNGGLNLHRTNDGKSMIFHRRASVLVALILGFILGLPGATLLQAQSLKNLAGSDSSSSPAGSGSQTTPLAGPNTGAAVAAGTAAGTTAGEDDSQADLPTPGLPGSPQAANSTDDLAPLSDSAPAMSATQIIRRLKKNPELMLSVRQSLAVQLGVSPVTLSDDDVFSHLKSDVAARTLATRAIRAALLANSNAGKTNVPAAGAQAPVEPDLQVQPIPHYLPYPNLPAMQDLYTQLATPTALRRFGSDVLSNGSGNPDELPEDVPAGPDYVLGSGDMLTLNLWGGLTVRLARLVDRQGQVTVPEAGAVRVTGLTIAQAQEALQKALSGQYRNSHVEISLARVRTIRVYVVGDVQRPGAYDVSALSTPLNALFSAGGPTSHGSLRILRLMRDGKLVRDVDLYQFLLKGVHDTSDRMQAGDTLVVPPVGPQVTVSGMVRRPAIYEIKGESSLKDVLEMAGGVETTAELKRIEIERVEPHQSRTMASVEYDPAKPSRLDGYTVRDGDSVKVSQIQPYNSQAVSLSGHVYHPGTFAWHEGITLADLIPSYQVLMPEPNDHAEIVRLLPPDYRPRTLEVNLADVLAGNIQVNLEPMDQVRVFGRYEVDTPTVAIRGDVLRPNDYPMSKGMTVSALVEMAGGLTRSAYRPQADLTSYTVVEGRTVITRNVVVDLEKALRGDRASDILLQPGDVLGVREITGWHDIGSSVTISGEVGHAGTYGITAGERLSSVLKRAGDFRERAFPEGAILTRVQVRELESRNRDDMIRRMQEAVPTIDTTASGTQEQASSTMQAMQAQREQVLAALRAHPVDGRQVIHITANIQEWENTAADIELRAGDQLTIPKRPNFVMVGGQVYNSAAITYVPGKTAGWYLSRAGGATQSANKKAIYVVRADGSVAGHGTGLFQGGVLSVRLRPGDTVLVPEKILGGNVVWRNLISLGQVLATTSIAAAAAGVF
ncbi:MAG: SLBB domain-containing protein [Acidobacteriota bacterium]|nr:SLBB domain-containing protein [Acidobacteriota bacterium]